MICEHCLQPIGESVTRGGLTVTTQPLAAFWNGRLLHGLLPMHCRILALFIKRGSVSTVSFMIQCLGEDTAARTLQVHICRLRKLLPKGITIETVSGWGYKLEIEEAA